MYYGYWVKICLDCIYQPSFGVYSEETIHRLSEPGTAPVCGPFHTPRQAHQFARALNKLVNA